MPNGKDISFVSDLVRRSWKDGGPALVLMLAGAVVVLLPLFSDKYGVAQCNSIGMWLFIMAVAVYLVRDLLDHILKRSYARHRVEQESKVVEVLGVMASSTDLSASDFVQKSQALEGAVDRLILAPGQHPSPESEKSEGPSE